MRSASRLAACLLLALAFAGQGLLSHAARAAKTAAVIAAPSLCVTDPDGSGHGPAIDCVVHCLPAAAADGPGLSATAMSVEVRLPSDDAERAVPDALPPQPFSLDHAARAPPGHA